MYILNCTNTNDIFVENSYKHYGVQHSASVVVSDYGISWVNRHTGVWHYDGQNFTNLIKDKIDPIDLGINKRNIDGTKCGIREGDVPVVMFDPVGKNLYVIPDVYQNRTAYGSGSFTATNFNQDALVYNFESTDWYTSNGLLYDSTASAITNSVFNRNGNILYLKSGVAGTSYPLSGTHGLVMLDSSQLASFNANRTLGFETKEIDFGDVSTWKKVYKVIIKYRKACAFSATATRGIAVSFRINGSDSYTQVNNTTYDTNFRRDYMQSYKDGATNDTTDDWVVQEFIPASPMPRLKTFSVVFGGVHVHSEFEIDSISVAYRMVGVSQGLTEISA
jgi:hypothetical protein